MIQGLFRTVLDDPLFAAGRLVLNGSRSTQLAQLAAGGLLPIERVLVLRLIPLFARAASDDLLKLASMTHEIRLTADVPLVTEKDPAALYAVIAGEVSLVSISEPSVAVNGGDAIGVYETLAGVPLGRQARVVREGHALKIDRDALFDLPAHRPMLIQEIFGALFRVRSTEVMTS